MAKKNAKSFLVELTAHKLAKKKEEEANKKKWAKKRGELYRKHHPKPTTNKPKKPTKPKKGDPYWKNRKK